MNRKNLIELLVFNFVQPCLIPKVDPLPCALKNVVQFSELTICVSVSSGGW